MFEYWKNKKLLKEKHLVEPGAMNINMIDPAKWIAIWILPGSINF